MYPYIEIVAALMLGAGGIDRGGVGKEFCDFFTRIWLS